MNYRVELSPAARAYLRRLDRTTQQRIDGRIHQLSEDPYGLQSKPLAGLPGLRSSRVGRWRIIFEVDEGASMVNVIRIGSRGQVYRGL